MTESGVRKKSGKREASLFLDVQHSVVHEPDAIL